ncbi:hypothetical protein JG687_00017583 [Phytophthora cactorum]|uniref:FAR1 domain-containing protein n=1 Tax=Phytophthora cactorum TaxID=29920 RepID=A0A8T1TPX8_9STRA|nr:hypothetical protein JG687_00017583 [Phytophthora cactorum]
MCEEFNVTSEEKETMEYEFDFPDYNLDVRSISQPSDDDFEWLDDSLLDLICKHHLELEEKDSSDDFGNSETTSGGAADLQVSSNESSVEEEIYIIPPPPEKTYESHDIADTAIHEWTLQHNYNVSRRRVRYISGTKKIWARNYECDRVGRPTCTQHLTDSEGQHTMRRSKRRNCPMRLKMSAVSKGDISGPWEIVHTGNKSEVHTHPPSDDVRVHAAHRRRVSNNPTS